MYGMKENIRINSEGINSERIRILESTTRMRYLLGNNPTAELIRILQRYCNENQISKADNQKINL